MTETSSEETPVLLSPPKAGQEKQDDKYKLVGKLVILHGEEGARYPALVLGGYEGADYVNLIVFIDPQSAGHSPTVHGQYLIQVSPGTEPGQFSEV